MANGKKFWAHSNSIGALLSISRTHFGSLSGNCAQKVLVMVCAETKPNRDRINVAKTERDTHTFTSNRRCWKQTRAKLNSRTPTRKGAFDPSPGSQRRVLPR